MKKWGATKRGVRVLYMSLAGLLLVACFVLIVAQKRRSSSQQERPRRVFGSRSSTINVKANGDLQGALNAAQPGDTIVLEAGATFTGSFTLPYKAGTGTDADYITIRSSSPDASLPLADQRITPAFAPLLPKIISRGQGASALQTAPRAHHYRLIGIEISKQSAD